MTTPKKLSAERRQELLGLVERAADPAITKEALRQIDEGFAALEAELAELRKPVESGEVGTIIFALAGAMGETKLFEAVDHLILRLSRELAEVKERVHYAEGVADLAIQHRTAAEAREAKLREALEKLSRLGNEPELGNSIGNMIARAALAPEGKEGGK